MLWRAFDIARGVGCIVIALFLLITVGAAAQDSIKSTRQEEKDVNTEHRFSVLETKVDGLMIAMEHLEYLKWIEMLGVSSLVGEAGFRLVKRK